MWSARAVLQALDSNFPRADTMGIVSFCPQGHRVKVKDHLAGRKGICPTCGARFRIPLASVDPPPAAGASVASAALRVAEIVSLDAAVAERLPRALPLARAFEPAVAPLAAPVADSGRAVTAPAARVAEEHDAVEPAARLHPLIAARVDLAWCHARPGGAASDPLQAAAMQAWLDSGAAAADALVWRADWGEWRPLAMAFPEYARR